MKTLTQPLSFDIYALSTQQLGHFLTFTWLIHLPSIILNYYLLKSILYLGCPKQRRLLNLAMPLCPPLFSVLESLLPLLPGMADLLLPLLFCLKPRNPKIPCLSPLPCSPFSCFFFIYQTEPTGVRVPHPSCLMCRHCVSSFGDQNWHYSTSSIRPNPLHCSSSSSIFPKHKVQKLYCRCMSWS